MSEESASASAPAGEGRRLHPATLLTRWLRIIPQMLGGGAAYAFAAQEGRDLLPIILLALIAGAAVSLLGWWRFSYSVEDREIVIESGILQRRRRVIPFDRVQDVAIERRPIARLLGTAAVRIETGGSSSDEGLLDMISLAEAESLRDRLRRGASAAEAMEPEEPIVFGMKLGRVLLSGLFGFSLLFLAVLFAVAENLAQAGLVDLTDLVATGNAQARGLRATNPLYALLLVPVLLGAGMVAGVIRALARDFGFRLSLAEIRSEDGSRPGLRRRRGLLTLSETVIPVHRIQSAVIASGAVGRRFGWYSLSFQTLGADSRKQSLQVAAPFARLNEIASVLNVAGLPMPPDVFEPLPRRALWRWAGQYLPVALLALLGAAFVSPWAGLGALALLLLAVRGALGWRRHGHALEGEILFVRNGLLRRRVWILPLVKLQTLSRWQGPLQRRLRLATLLVDTPGAPALAAPEIVDLDAADSEQLGEILLQRFRASRRNAAGVVGLQPSRRELPAG